MLSNFNLLYRKFPQKIKDKEIRNKEKKFLTHIKKAEKIWKMTTEIILNHKKVNAICPERQILGNVDRLRLQKVPTKKSMKKLQEMLNKIIKLLLKNSFKIMKN